ncbi:amidohydrolase family protein [Nocardia sp. NBC_00565]|uniref:N-acyl-D-amino-acid deacylase family protein n=1 Tax=Nocardia sp. NBC_00565 TaxID=2975993 RepID=UPI002E812124|nr:amidohydrolase family protein [Nocardia sp. NBC_00565]WUC07266.1 amidohydrolase family protein [Nocardia sp. NBC_00565]
MEPYELVVKGGMVFDGTVDEPTLADVGVRDGRVVAISAAPLVSGSARVIDACGKWVTPGLVDVHTHYDAEVLVSPGIGESVRHGVTTVIIGNCSLSTVYADAEDCADIFARVEALPWDAVHGAVQKHRSWDDPRSYIKAIESRPLGLNVAALIGHSDIRVAAMGLARSVDGSKPTDRELSQMIAMLREALDAGFLGLSTIRSSFSKVAGARHPARQLPSTYADWREYRALNDLLRAWGRIHQCTPNLTRRAEVARFFAQSSGRLHRKPLKTTLIAALDISADRKTIWAALASAWMANRTLGADFRFQHLPVPFLMYGDGIDLVVFEEFGSGEAALNIRDEIGRGALLVDEDFRRRFRKDMTKRFSPRVWHRDLSRAHITECPDTSLVGLSFAAIAETRRVHPADAFLDLVVEHGSQLRWRTVVGNDRPEVLNRVANSPSIQMGFNDSGAHLRNMAFYNSGLRMLARAWDAQRNGRPFMTTAQVVHRLTAELGEWYGIDAGALRIGSRADIAVIDPAGLVEAGDDYSETPMPEFGGMSRMVNRNDGAVAATIVNGHVVYEYGTFADGFGRTVHAGTFLRAR